MRGARYAPAWTRTTRTPATPGCCCGAPWSTSRPCRPAWRGRAPASRPGRCTQVPTAWSPTWFPARPARQASGTAASTWSGTTPSRATCSASLGVLDGETVHGSLAPGALPGPVRERLAGFAAANWPSPWREALTLALRTEPCSAPRSCTTSRGGWPAAGPHWPVTPRTPPARWSAAGSGRDCTTWPPWPGHGRVHHPRRDTWRAAPLPGTAARPGRPARRGQRAGHRRLPGPRGRGPSPVSTPRSAGIGVGAVPPRGVRRHVGGPVRQQRRQLDADRRRPVADAGAHRLGGLRRPDPDRGEPARRAVRGAGRGHRRPGGPARASCWSPRP